MATLFMICDPTLAQEEVSYLLAYEELQRNCAGRANTIKNRNRSPLR